MERTELSDKHFKYLLYLLDDGNTTHLHRLLSHSIIYTEPCSDFSGDHYFFVCVEPEIFRTYQKFLDSFARTISSKFYDFSQIRIRRVTFYADLDKFKIVGNRIIPVFTPWEEINNCQEQLINYLSKSHSAQDFQNIGLTSLTIMDKLAREVFDPLKHKHSDPKAELQNGKSKNQLHAYINTVLAGSDNKIFRKLAESSIDLVQKAIDFMNETKHDLNAKEHFAEVCVISTVNAVSIVKFVKQLE